MSYGCRTNTAGGGAMVIMLVPEVNLSLITTLIAGWGRCV